MEAKMSPVPGREAPAMGLATVYRRVVPQEIDQRIPLADAGDDDGCTDRIFQTQRSQLLTQSGQLLHRPFPILPGSPGQQAGLVIFGVIISARGSSSFIF